MVTWLAAIMTLPVGTGVPMAIAHAEPDVIFAVLFLGVVVTTIPLVYWTWVLGRVPASVASSSLLLIGPSAVVISWLALGETPSAIALVGGAVTLTGVTVTQLRPTRRPANPLLRTRNDLATGPEATAGTLRLRVKCSSS